jgi:hypothetical protein
MLRSFNRLDGDGSRSDSEMATGAIQAVVALLKTHQPQKLASGRLWALWSRPTRRPHRAASRAGCVIVLAAASPI